MIHRHLFWILCGAAAPNFCIGGRRVRFFVGFVQNLPHSDNGHVVTCLLPLNYNAANRIWGCGGCHAVIYFTLRIYINRWKWVWGVGYPGGISRWIWMDDSREGSKAGRSSENFRKEIVQWESDRSREPKWKKRNWTTCHSSFRGPTHNPLFFWGPSTHFSATHTQIWRIWNPSIWLYGVSGLPFKLMLCMYDCWSRYQHSVIGRIYGSDHMNPTNLWTEKDASGVSRDLPWRRCLTDFFWLESIVSGNTCILTTISTSAGFYFMAPSSHVIIDKGRSYDSAQG